ncbi:hypothetical protein EB796_004982 [Bugula neritina]|uniref:Uncharacterized protein n=1 Tax=Bugula neritina TaxID=10212 RepID=A0A7J7KDH5_BUGNE|nr:hypothetical protein EB796_004982 [Bugula neritina]
MFYASALVCFISSDLGTRSETQTVSKRAFGHLNLGPEPDWMVLLSEGRTRRPSPRRKKLSRRVPLAGEPQIVSDKLFSDIQEDEIEKEILEANNEIYRKRLLELMGEMVEEREEDERISLDQLGSEESNDEEKRVFGSLREIRKSVGDDGEKRVFGSFKELRSFDEADFNEEKRVFGSLRQIREVGRNMGYMNENTATHDLLGRTKKLEQAERMRKWKKPEKDGDYEMVEAPKMEMSMDLPASKASASIDKTGGEPEKESRKIVVDKVKFIQPWMNSRKYKINIKFDTQHCRWRSMTEGSSRDEEVPQASSRF